MRSDMSKVIVERPRKKGRAWIKPKGYQRRLRQYGDDGPPACEGIKACWGAGKKILNEHLGPLRRYLDKQVGRPWNKVFSEICEHISRNSAVQDHVRDHVLGYVAVHVVLIDGVPCDGAGSGYGTPLHRWRYPTWYVCPCSGLLRRVKRRRRAPTRSRAEDTVAFVQVDDMLQCRMIDGAWHLVTLKMLPDPGDRIAADERDILLKRPASRITPEEARRHYGALVYAIAMRRLALRELRHFPIPR